MKIKLFVSLLLSLFVLSACNFQSVDYIASDFDSSKVHIICNDNEILLDKEEDKNVLADIKSLTKSYKKNLDEGYITDKVVDYDSAIMVVFYRNDNLIESITIDKNGVYNTSESVLEYDSFTYFTSKHSKEFYETVLKEYSAK